MGNSSGSCKGNCFLQVAVVHEYIGKVEQYNYVRMAVTDCCNHKYITKLGDNIYKSYIWMKLSEYLEYLSTNNIPLPEMLIQFFNDNPDIAKKYNIFQ